jgi:hypothetical protein
MLVLLQKSNFDYFYLDCRNVLGVDHDARRDLPRRPGADHFCRRENEIVIPFF